MRPGLDGRRADHRIILWQYSSNKSALAAAAMKAMKTRLKANNFCCLWKCIDFEGLWHLGLANLAPPLATSYVHMLTTIEMTSFIWLPPKQILESSFPSLGNGLSIIQFLKARWKMHIITTTLLAFRLIQIHSITYIPTVTIVVENHSKCLTLQHCNCKENSKSSNKYCHNDTDIPMIQNW